MRTFTTKSDGGRGFLAAVAVSSTALILSACGGGGAGKSDTDPGVNTTSKTVSVGGFQVASGPFASQAAAGRGAEACIKGANARGGVNGWKFKIKLDDTGGDPARALAETKAQVLGNKTFAMIWAGGTTSNQAVIPYILGKDMPYQPGMSYDGLAKLKSLPNIFPVIPAYSSLAEHLADFAIDKLSAKRVALLYENAGLGQDTHAALGKYLKKRGVQLVAEVPVAPDDTDFTPMGIALSKAKPDAVIVAANPTALVKTKAATMSNGVDVPWLSQGYNATDSTMKLDPATTDGTYFNTYLEPFFGDTKAAKAFREDIDKFATHNQVPDTQAIIGYGSCQLFLEGFKRMTASGATPTQAGLIKAWETIGTTQVGVNKALTVTKGKHSGNSAAYIIRWKDGAWDVAQDATPLPGATS